MSQIKRVPKKDYTNFIDIGCNAYPGMGIKSREDKARLRKRFIESDADPALKLWGLYDRSELRGGLRLFDFTMNMYGNWVKIGGGGFLAVDLTHKKEKVARDLMQFFIGHYRQRGYSMTTLYPFRPDFYRKMGFGYGAKMNRYLISPADLPKTGDKSYVRFLTDKDIRLLSACYSRYAAQTHGMFRRCKYQDIRLRAQQPQMVGFVRKNRVEGYIVFSFKPAGEDNFVFNNLHIEEMVCENRAALLGLLTFLNTQADQINKVILSTHDENFHFLPHDPRTGSNRLVGMVAHETNAQGVGIMYRVIDTPGLWKNLSKHSFGGENIKLKLTLIDSFVKENAGSYVLHFTNGRPHLKRSRDWEVEVTMDVAEFSSLIVGAVDYRSLYQYGQAEISDTGYLGRINRMFLAERKPECLAQF